MAPAVKYLAAPGSGSTGNAVTARVVDQYGKPVRGHQVIAQKRRLGLYGFVNMGTMALVKTTVDVNDELLLRAKRHAKATGQPLRAVVEQGLRVVLAGAPPARYVMPDLRVGEHGEPCPLDRYSWSELRDLIYNDP